MAGPGLSADWEHLRYEVCPSQGGWGGSSGHTQPQGGHLVTLGLCSLGHLTAVLTSKPVLVQIANNHKHAIAVARWLQCSDCGGKFAEAGCKDVGKLFN